MKVTKENNIQLTRDPTASLLSDNVGYLDKVFTSLIIEVDVTIQNKTIRKLKDDYLFLFNDMETTFYDKPMVKYIEKPKYEQAVGELKKWRSWIQIVIRININVLSKKELDNVQSEYGEVVYFSRVSNGIYEMNDVWNESDNEKVPDEKLGKYHNNLLTDNDRILTLLSFF